VSDSASTAASAVVAGTWRFTLVSLAGFAPWVLGGRWFYRTIGEGGLYAVCLFAFLGAAVLLLPALLTGERRVRRTLVWFLPAFTTYAVIWCACWFGFGGRTGEWSGALVGGAAFVALSAWALGRPRAPLITTLVFLVAHTAGYFAGDQAYHACAAAAAPKMLGMSAWGVCYGVGFGAGIGWLVHACRDPRDA
jgi:hypothetical protein